MPTISMFYGILILLYFYDNKRHNRPHIHADGILILLYFYDNKRHNRPHIHAEYAEHTAVVAIDDGAVLDGSLPIAKMKLVQAWIEIHRETCLQIGS